LASIWSSLSHLLRIEETEGLILGDVESNVKWKVKVMLKKKQAMDEQGVRSVNMWHVSCVLGPVRDKDKIAEKCDTNSLLDLYVLWCSVPELDQAEYRFYQSAGKLKS